MNIAGFIDHTILKPTTTIAEVKNLCSEAEVYGFAAVCVPPPFVQNAKSILKNSQVRVATVIGFPFGYSAAKAKLVETTRSLDDGADELDIVINLIALKGKVWGYLESELKQSIELIHGTGKIVKVIIESGILSDEEIIKCCEIYAAAGVDYVKTSTGYAEKGATIEAVQLMRANLPSTIKIKASEGIRGFQLARDLVAAGADRLGCSSSVAIVNEQMRESNEGL